MALATLKVKMNSATIRTPNPSTRLRKRHRFSTIDGSHCAPNAIAARRRPRGDAKVAAVDRVVDEPDAAVCHATHYAARMQAGGAEDSIAAAGIVPFGAVVTRRAVGGQNCGECGPMRMAKGPQVGAQP